MEKQKIQVTLSKTTADALKQDAEKKGITVSALTQLLLSTKYPPIEIITK